MIEIYGVILTYPYTDLALLLFKVKTAFIYIGDKGNRLSEIYVYCFVLRYVLIKLIRVFDRAVFNAGRTPRAFALIYIPGLLSQGDLKISCFSFDTVNFSIGQDLYVRMPADLDQFGRQYSDGAVIGGKGLVQLGHHATDGGGPFYEIDIVARIGQI